MKAKAENRSFVAVGGTAAGVGNLRRFICLEGATDRIFHGALQENQYDMGCSAPSRVMERPRTTSPAVSRNRYNQRQSG